MDQSRLLIGLLVLATLVVDAAVLVSLSASPGRHSDRLLILALVLSQVGLLAIWAGWAGSTMPWRLLLTIAAATVVSELLERTNLWPDRNRFSDQLTLYATMLALATTGSIVAARAAGFRMERPIDETHPRRSSPRFQFRLAHLMGWLTATALILGLLEYSLAGGLRQVSPSRYADDALCGAAMAAMVLATMTSVLSSGARAWHLPLWAAAVALAIVVWHFAGDPWRVAATVNITAALWALMSLAIVRIAGYHIAWPRR